MERRYQPANGCPAVFVLARFRTMRRNTFFAFRFLLFLFFIRPVFAESPIQERADRFLELANSGYQALYRVNSEAQWLAVTDVTPAHDAAAEATGKAYAAFNGNPDDYR